jgi:hypothetical protein
MADVITQQQLQLLPEYQEKYLKDLFANIYRTEERPVLDPETGEPMVDEQGEPIMESYAAGIAATSPLYGQPQFDPETGEPIYQRDAQGNLMLDASGQPIQKVVGGVPRPDVMPLTPAQQQAIQLGISGIGAYAPLMESAKGTYGMGVTSAMSGYDEFGRPLAYDPQSYRPYYDPYVEEVIDRTQADIQRSGDIQRQRAAGQAVGAGAFGGSRAAVQQQEIQRNIEEQKARTGAQLRSQAFNQAQQQAQSAFQNQMQRGQTGAQIFQGLGTAQAGLGQLAQTLGYQDVQNLMNVGGIEQKQRQAEYDVQRQAAIEEAYEPFQRFSYMSDIFRGVPSTQSTMVTGSAPQQNVLGSTIGTAMGLGAYQNQYGSILPGLGG